MKIISFIKEPDVIRKILVHLDLWDVLNRDPPAAKYTQIHELTYGDSYFPNFHLLMPGFNELRIYGMGTGAIKIDENDGDFQNFKRAVLVL